MMEGGREGRREGGSGRVTSIIIIMQFPSLPNTVFTYNQL